MKADLLSLGYCGVSDIQFPVEVTLVKEQWYGLEGYAISTEEVIRIGGDPEMFLEGGTYPLVEEEFELFKVTKVRLLTDGNYQSMAHVEIGTIFEAKIWKGLNLAHISRKDLLAAGANGDYFSVGYLSFFVGSEVEIVGEEDEQN